MNKETNELLEKLASKMGTTAEYLWSVLIKQSQIDAWTSIFQYGLIILFGVVLYRLHRKYSIETDGRYSSVYDKYNEDLIIPMIIGALVFVFMAASAFFSIPDTVNGFINPEYWALKEVLNSIR